MNKLKILALGLASMLIFAIPAAAENILYDPPPEAGSVNYDAPPVQVPFSVDPGEVSGVVSYDAPPVQVPFFVDPPADCVDVAPETSTVAGDLVTVDPPERCIDPPPASGDVTYDAAPVDVPFTVDPGVVSGEVTYDAAPVSVPYTHDPAPRNVAFPSDCSDGRDNDADGQIDFPLDAGCADADDLLEAPNPNPPPPPPPPIGSQCVVADWQSWGWQDCEYGTLIEVTNQGWRCTQPLSNYGPLPIKVIVYATQRYDDGYGVTLDRSCSGVPGGRVDLIADIRGDGVNFGSGHDAFKTRQAGTGNLPTNVEVTGSFNCGPTAPNAHQDTTQYQSVAPNIDLINVRSGNWDAGIATCDNGGGAPIYTQSPPNSDITGALFVGCNHGILGSPGSGSLLSNSGWRVGSPSQACNDVPNVTPPCPSGSPVWFDTPTNICQIWNGTSWEDQ